MAAALQIYSWTAKKIAQEDPDEAMKSKKFSFSKLFGGKILKSAKTKSGLDYTYDLVAGLLVVGTWLSFGPQCTNN